MKIIKSTFIKYVFLAIGLVATSVLFFAVISACGRMYFPPKENYDNFNKSAYISNQINNIYNKLAFTQKQLDKIEDINNSDFEKIKIYDYDEENVLSETDDKTKNDKDSETDDKAQNGKDSETDDKTQNGKDSETEAKSEESKINENESSSYEYNLDDYIKMADADNLSSAKILYNYLINNLTYQGDGNTMRETIKYNENSTNEVHKAFLGKKNFYKMSLASFETFIKEKASVLPLKELLDVYDRNGSLIDNYYIYNEYAQNEYLFGDEHLAESQSYLVDYGRREYAGDFYKNIYVYEKDENVFFYDMENQIFYNTVSGFVKIDNTKDNGYIYFPADYVNANGDTKYSDDLTDDFLVSPLTASAPMCYLKTVSDDIYAKIQDLYSLNIHSHYWLNINNMFTPGRELVQVNNNAGIICYYKGKVYSNFEVVTQKESAEETFKYYQSKLMENADVYVSKTGSETDSKCRNSKGEFEDYQYFSEDIEEAEIQKADFDFAISYVTSNLTASDNYELNLKNYIYDIAGALPHPYITGGIAALILLLMIILLTINADKRKYIDKIPVLLLLIVPAGLMFILILIVKEEASYFTGLKMAKNYNDLFVKLNASFAVCIVLFYFMIAELYLTCVRRIKNKDYKKNIFYKFFAWIKLKIKSNNANIRLSLKNKGLKNVSIKLGATIIVTYLMALVLIFSFNTDASFMMFVIVTALAVYFFTTVMKLLAGMSKIEAKTEKISNQNFEEENVAFTKGETADSEVQKSLPVYLQKTYGNLVGISDSFNKAVIRATKDERTKAELITNVSHDIKTPLTSIINYVDLIKRENVDNPKIK
ncbi:MAG: hypothetical protein K6G11_05625, partial [Lachnospiraceae bacterium]|nr:hypothetical protein [Lachnospiraceae bacterium]